MLYELSNAKSLQRAFGVSELSISSEKNALNEAETSISSMRVPYSSLAGGRCKLVEDPPFRVCSQEEILEVAAGTFLGLGEFDLTKISWWWFQIFLFSPLLGEDSHFDEYFSNGLKPPTRLV